MLKFLTDLFIPKEALQKIIDEAKQKAREIILKANEDAVKVRQQAEMDSRRITAEAIQAEKELNKARSLIGQEKADVTKERQSVEEDKKLVLSQRQQTETIKQELEERREALLTKLEHIAQLTKDQAKDLIIKGVEDKMKEDVAKRYTTFEEEFKTKATEKAKEMLTDAMRFAAVDYTAEYTLSVV